MGLGSSMKILEVVIRHDGRLDTANASKYVGLSVKTLAMMRSTGKGPIFLKRGKVFYFKEDLDDWLNAPGRSRSTAQAKQAMRTPKATGIFAD